jgi:hypothetical protein
MVDRRATAEGELPFGTTDTVHTPPVVRMMFVWQHKDSLRCFRLE